MPQAGPSPRDLTVEDVFVEGEVVGGRVGAGVVGSTVRVLGFLVILHLTFTANVHVVCLAEAEVLDQEGGVALLGSLPGSGLKVTSSVGCDDVRPLLELEGGARELEDRHDAVASQAAVFEVAVLLAVEVLLALGLHVLHVLRHIDQVRLKVAGARVYHVVDKEGQEFLFS